MTELLRELLGNYLGTAFIQQGTTFYGCSSRCSSRKYPPDIGITNQFERQNPDMAGVRGEGTTELQEEEHMGIN